MGTSGADTIDGSQNQWYLAPEGISTPNTVQDNVWMSTSALSSTAANLAVSVGLAPTSPSGWTFALLVEPSGHTLICQIPSGGSVCFNTTGSLSIPAGSTVVFEAIPSASPPATQVTFGWTESTP